MRTRNFSPQRMFEAIAASHEPECSFPADGRISFEKWKAETLPRVLDTLGTWDRPVDLEPELLAEWRHDGLIKQRWLIQVHRRLSATVLVARNESVGPNAPAPAILCWHGHGDLGKEVVMGDDSTPQRRESIAEANYAYGHAMAKAGFVTFAIDWIGKGDHLEEAKPNWNNMAHGRDWCNLYYVHATMLGTTTLAINLAHGRLACDLVTGLPFVQADRLGVMGLSGGGTMTLWTALTDERISAAEIICYSAYWPHFGFRDVNYCGMQVTPGLFSLVHLHDLQGLLAPLPLLIDIGAADTCFPIDEAMRCYRGVERIYTAAGAPERLELDLHPGGHGWGGNRSVDFFNRHLAES